MPEQPRCRSSRHYPRASRPARTRIHSNHQVEHAAAGRVPEVRACSARRALSASMASVLFATITMPPEWLLAQLMSLKKPPPSHSQIPQTRPVGDRLAPIALLAGDDTDPRVAGPVRRLAFSPA